MERGLEILVCQKDHLSARFVCERIVTSNGDLVLSNIETDDGVIWDSVHFPLNTIESYYIKTI